MKVLLHKGLAIVKAIKGGPAPHKVGLSEFTKKLVNQYNFQVAITTFSLLCYFKVSKKLTLFLLRKIIFINQS